MNQNTIRRIMKTFDKIDKIAVMAFVSVETKAEVMMVKFFLCGVENKTKSPDLNLEFLERQKIKI